MLVQVCSLNQEFEVQVSNLNQQKAIDVITAALKNQFILMLPHKRISLYSNG